LEIAVLCPPRYLGGYFLNGLLTDGLHSQRPEVLGKAIHRIFAERRFEHKIGLFSEGFDELTKHWFYLRRELTPHVIFSSATLARVSRDPPA